MKRSEIEEKIGDIITHNSYHENQSFLYGVAQLTDLFIQLSEERCKEQRYCCVRVYALKDNLPTERMLDLILNSPLPTLD